MEQWQDQGIILQVRAHGENGAVVSLLTPHLGRVAGYVRGAGSSKMRGTLEIGNLVDARWSARTEGQLGSYTLELSKNHAAGVMDDSLKLGALQSACALCHDTLPEREVHEGLYHGLLALFEMLQGEVWGAAYVMWEIALLRELGFSLDLTKCAGGGDAATLAYVSPKTGRAVSYAQAQPYKEKLLELPSFLKPNGGPCEDEDVITGLKLTGYFLEHWVFAHHSNGPSTERLRLFDRFAKTLDNSNDTPKHASR